MLPEACGLPTIGKEGLKDPEDLASRLRTALHEIRVAYPTLIHRLELALLQHLTSITVASTDRYLKSDEST